MPGDFRFGYSPSIVFYLCVLIFSCPIDDCVGPIRSLSICSNCVSKISVGGVSDDSSDGCVSRACDGLVVVRVVVSVVFMCWGGRVMVSEVFFWQ